MSFFSDIFSSSVGEVVGKVGESKEEFINKIITKADAYKAFYGQILGKLHAKQKELSNATTIEALKAIAW